MLYEVQISGPFGHVVFDTLEPKRSEVEVKGCTSALICPKLDWWACTLEVFRSRGIRAFK